MEVDTVEVQPLLKDLKTSHPDNFNRNERLSRVHRAIQSLFQIVMPNAPLADCLRFFIQKLTETVKLRFIKLRRTFKFDQSLTNSVQLSKLSNRDVMNGEIQNILAKKAIEDRF